MSESDYRAGKSGADWHPGMNREDYDAGKAKLKAEENLRGFDWGPKVEVPGVAYTLILVAPALFAVYPILGVLVMAVFAGTWWAATVLRPPVAVSMLVGLALCFGSFFLGLRLELAASQAVLYRVFRSLWRPLVVVGGAFLAMGKHSSPEAAGQALGGAIVLAVVIHFVCSFIDRLYFPVKAHVLRQREQLAKGMAPTRGLAKRWLYGLLWLLPVLILCSVIGNTALKYAAPEQIETLRPAVYLAGLAVWFLLCVLGLLPGTSKRKRLLVDPNLVKV